MKFLVALAILVAWILEALLAKWLFVTPFILIGVAVGAVSAAFAQYGQLLDSWHRGHWPYTFNLVITPLLGMLVGLLVAHVAAPSMIADKSDHVTVALVLAIIAGLYGFWVAPFLSPWFLRVDDTVAVTLIAWALALLSFICLAYAWGLVAVGIHLHLFH